MTAEQPIQPAEAKPTAHSVRTDAITVIIMSVLAAGAVITLAAFRSLRLFTPDGVAWTLPVEPQTLTADGLTLYSSSGPAESEPITGTATALEVIVNDLNTVSTVCLAASIVIIAIAALIAIACTARIAWLFLRGRFFTRSASAALRTLNWSLAAGVLFFHLLWTMGRNGVEAALNVRAQSIDGFEWWGWYWIVLFAIVSLGLVDVALRRAIRLQQDTEGLV
ncbi:hypothetical protein [Leucobacter sp. GX24907]